MTSSGTQAEVVADIVAVWSDLNPAAGYTGGHLEQLTGLFLQSAENMHAMRARIDKLRGKVDIVEPRDLRATADAVLVSLRTQIDLSRPSGAGPSGTGMGGVWAAADGIFYIVLKGDHDQTWVLDYLDAVCEAVEFETTRWLGQEFTVEVRRECLDTATYLRGTLTALTDARKGDHTADKMIDQIRRAADDYTKLFELPNLGSDRFIDYWPVFKEWDAIAGPATAKGYPECISSYYQLDMSASQIEDAAMAWLELDLPVTVEIAQRIDHKAVDRPRTLGKIWKAVQHEFSVDFTPSQLDNIVGICNAYGNKHIVGFTKSDKVLFGPTPDYLVNLVTGGEDFAVDYLRPDSAYSQLYLTAAKNTSLLTMINILVHEASHGFNFVLSAKHAPSPLLNLNTALQVPLTEGQAFYREFQYWAAAQDLLGRCDLDQEQSAYLGLYGSTADEQARGVLCAQLETYIWRVIRYIRALCDVRVNGGAQTYTDFIAWASTYTGLSEETLHGECFVFLSEPGYAPCYAVGGATYGLAQKSALLAGVSELDFNTRASAMGFYPWPVESERLRKINTEETPMKDPERARSTIDAIHDHMALDAHYPFDLQSGWLPSPQSPAMREYFDMVLNAAPQPLRESVRELDAYIESNDVIAHLVDSACRANANILAAHLQAAEDVGVPRIASKEALLAGFNEILNHPPRFVKDELVGLPFSAFVVGIDPTLAGMTLFGLPMFNEKMAAVLDEWNTFLASPASNVGFRVDGEQWLSEAAKKQYQFPVWKKDSEELPYWRSWNSFFTRQFAHPEKDRPIAHPETNRVVICPNDGSLFRWEPNVAKQDVFWFKDMRYSLADILCSPDDAQQALIDEYCLVELFEGGTVFQTYLNPYNFHRWWVPVNGEVLFDPITIPGAFFNKLVIPDFGGASTASLPYLAQVNARGLIVFKTEDYGHVCCIPLGMSEVSSIEFDAEMTCGATVNKGDEMGMFNYGGSSFAVIYEKLPGKDLYFVNADGKPYDQKPVLPKGSAGAGGEVTNIGSQIGVWVDV